MDNLTENLNDLTDAFQRNNGITEETLLPPASWFSLAVVDKNGVVQFNPNNLADALTRLLASPGSATALAAKLSGTDLTTSGVLSTLATNVGAHDTQGILLLAALLATTGAADYVVDVLAASDADLADLLTALLASTGAGPALLGALPNGTDGLQAMRVCRATFNPSLNAGERTIAAHTIGQPIPISAIVVGGFVQVNTLFDSADHSGSIALSIQGANDIISAAAINGAPFSTTGLKAIIPKANTPESTGIALTAARTLTATVTTTALTVGKLTAFLYYLVGA